MSKSGKHLLHFLRRRKKENDAELDEFRDLMEVPDTFHNGFSLSSLLGTFFVALVMVPGALYMELVAGMGIGDAAQWVTVLLFVEVAKRANATLNRAQLFILFYMAGMMLSQQIHGTPLFRQFLVQSDAAIANGITNYLEPWIAPLTPEAYENRTFLQLAWLPAIGLMFFRFVFGTIDSTIMGYGLFRLTSDVERLPFPMAPVGAQGIVALADQVEGSVKSAGGSMRWRMFCIGAGIGMIFGFLYMALPTLTGAFFNNPIMIFPIPFAEFTPYTDDYLKAVATGLSFDLGQVMIGMVLPFWAMVGSMVGLITTYVLNPILYRANVLTTWSMGDETVETLFSNNVDFYFSFGIGIALAIAIYGFINVFLSRRKCKNFQVPEKKINIKERGDIPSKFIIGTYLFTVSTYIGISGYLIHWDIRVMAVLVFFGFLYTPLISYVTARLEGIAGQVIEIPFVRELAFILSGYQGVAIWFLPIPKANYGIQTVRYKQAELLGCKFSSIWKSALILTPIIFLAMILFSSFIWSLAPIPSSAYPYAQEIWEFEAKNATLIYSSTLGEYSQFQEALGGGRIMAGLLSGLSMLTVLSWFGAPVTLVFGVVRGLGQTLPHVVIPNIIGALLGRYLFQKKYGREWRKMIPIVGAGYFVGAGLISIFAIGFVFLAKAVSTVPY